MLLPLSVSTLLAVFVSEPEPLIVLATVRLVVRPKTRAALLMIFPEPRRPVVVPLPTQSEHQMTALKTAYSAVTRKIEVQVAPKFLADRSSPENGYFFWAYTITLHNHGKV